jgi:hypothetical protein
MVQRNVPSVEDMIMTVCSQNFLDTNPTTNVLMAYINVSDKI